MENVATEEFISRTEALEDFEACNAANPRWTPQRVKTLLLHQPAADVAEVVRRKGCKHSTLPSELTQRYGVPGTRTCHNRYSPCNRRNVGKEDFCSYGERRGGGDDNVSD